MSAVASRCSVLGLPVAAAQAVGVAPSASRGKYTATLPHRHTATPPHRHNAAGGCQRPTRDGGDHAVGRSLSRPDPQGHRRRLQGGAGRRRRLSSATALTAAGVVAAGEGGSRCHVGMARVWGVGQVELGRWGGEQSVGGPRRPASETASEPGWCDLERVQGEGPKMSICDVDLKRAPTTYQRCVSLCVGGRVGHAVLGAPTWRGVAWLRRVERRELIA